MGQAHSFLFRKTFPVRGLIFWLFLYNQLDILVVHQSINLVLGFFLIVYFLPATDIGVI